MPQGVTVSSTSDSAEQVRAAAGLPPEKPAQLSLEDGERSEESRMQRERAENGNGKGPIPRGLSKRFDKIYAQMKSAQEEREQARAEAEQLRERLAQYEKPGAQPSRISEVDLNRRRRESAAENIIESVYERGNGAAPQQPEVQEAPRQEAQPQPEDHTIKALREEYADWDETFTRAEKENMRIADEAAQILHALPGNVRGHVSYFLAKNDELRTELNKLPPDQQASEIQRMARDMERVRNPEGKELAQKVKTSLTKEEREQIVQEGKKNQLGAAIVTSLVKELNYLPNGPQVMKYLVLNPDACEQFRSMSQQAASVELGRISARLENGNGARPVVSKAPAPITPLRGGALRSSVDLADPEIDFQSFKKEREKGSAERRRHGYGV
jgi:regulator of replication initiation timing